MGILNLPKLPQFRTKLPISGKEIRYRPITYREESFLLLVDEKETDNRKYTDAIINVIQPCVSGVDDLHELAMTDLIWLFIEIRKKSVGEVIEQRYRCRNVINEETKEICNESSDFNVNLMEAKLEGDVEITHEIAVDKENKYILTFSEPKIKDTEGKEETNEIIYTYLKKVQLADGKIIDKEDISIEEFSELLAFLSISELSNLRTKLGNLAQIVYRGIWKCPKCGQEDPVVISGLRGFFQ